MNVSLSAIALLICLAFGLGACGKKSDLTLPDNEQKSLAGLQNSQANQ